MRSRVELFEQIRRDRDREALSIHELARRHGVHRRTVRQALEAAVPPPRKRPASRPSPTLGPYRALIDSWLSPPCEHRVHARDAVGGARARVNLADGLEQLCVLERSLAGHPTFGSIEAGPRDAEHPTQGYDRVVGLLRADEAMHGCYVRPVSVAKKAAAFLRLSRSSRSYRSSRSSSARRARSSVFSVTTLTG